MSSQKIPAKKVVGRSSRQASNKIPAWAKKPQPDFDGVVNGEGLDHQLNHQQASAAGSQLVDVQDAEMRKIVQELQKRHQSQVQPNHINMEQSQGSEVDKNGQSNEISLAKDILESASTTEYLLLSLQKALQVEPIQVQLLLQNSNQKLLKLCNTGENGDFEPFKRWFKLLGEPRNFQYMIKLFLLAFDKNNLVDVTLMLQTIKCGIYSQDSDVAKMTVSLLLRITDSFAVLKSKPQHIQMIKNWFIEINKTPPQGNLALKSVLRGTSEMLEQHPSLVNEVSKLFYSIFKNGEPGLSKLPELLLENFQDDIFMVFETMHECLPQLHAIDREATKNLLLESKLIQNTIFQANTSEDYAVLMKCTNLLLEIWYLYPTLISGSESQINGFAGKSIRDSAYTIVKSGFTQKDKIFKINVFVCCFNLLDRLAEKENTEAPHLYKSIIQGLVFNYRNKKSDREIDQVTTEMILRGLSSLFKNQETIPKNIMLEPFLQQLTENVKTHPQGSNLMTTLELEFLLQMQKECGEKFEESTILSYLEFYTQVFLNRPQLSYAMKLSEHISTLIKQAKDHSTQVITFIISKLVPPMLATLHKLKSMDLNYELDPTPGEQARIRSQSKPKLSPTPGSKAYKNQEKQRKETYVSRQIKRFNIVDCLSKLYTALDGNQLQDQLVKQVEQSSHKYKQTYKCESTGMTHLLQQWGRLNMQSTNTDLAIIENNEDDEKGSGSKLERLRDKFPEEFSQGALVRWEQAKDPKNRIAMRAVEEYNEIKRKRLEREMKTKMEEVKKKQRQDRLNSEAKQQVQRRGEVLEREVVQRRERMKAVLGIPHVKSAERLLNLDQNLNEISFKTPKRLTGLQIMLANMDNIEEDRDLDSLAICQQTYHNLFRFLFDKYTSYQPIIGSSNRSNLDYLKEKTMKTQELIKLFREHAMDHRMISKSEILSLIKEVNDSMDLKYDTEELNFIGFKQFLIQFSVFLHASRRLKEPQETGGKKIKSLTFGEMFQNLMNWFKLAAKSRGFNTLLYEKPEVALDPSKEKQLNELNEQIISNPDMPLPAGFIKVTQKEQVKDYSLSKPMKALLGEAKTCVVELLDDIFTTAIGTHLIQPTIVLKEKPSVKFALQKASYTNNINAFSNRQDSKSKEIYSSALEISQKGSNIKNSELVGARFSNKKIIRKQSVASSQSQLVPLSYHMQDPLSGMNTSEGTTTLSTDKQYSSQIEQLYQIYQPENVMKTVIENRERSLDTAGGGRIAAANHNSVNGRSNRVGGVAIHGGEDGELGLMNHRAASLIAIKNANRFGKKVSLPINQTKEYSNKHGRRAMLERINERALFESTISKELKRTTYELQMHQHEDDFDTYLKTAQVMEDMLQVVSGEILKYPYVKKKVVGRVLQERAISLQAAQNKELVVKTRKDPGQLVSEYAKRQIQAKQKAEQEETILKEQKDLDRLKRDLRLKRKLQAYQSSNTEASNNSTGQSHLQMNPARHHAKGNLINKDGQIFDSAFSSSRQKGAGNASVKSQIVGAAQSKLTGANGSLASQSDHGTSVADISQSQIKVELTPSTLNKKQLVKLRAQQLAISQAERDAKKKAIEKEKEEKRRKEEEDKKKAGLEANKRAMAYKQELMQFQGAISQMQKEKMLMELTPMRRKNAIAAAEGVDNGASALAINEKKRKSQSVRKLQRLDKDTKYEEQLELKRSRAMIALQKTPAQLTKERQEVLAYYLRPDVQNVFDKATTTLSIFFDKLVEQQAGPPSLMRLNLAGYAYQFGKASGLVPQILVDSDLVLIFDTIVAERVDPASELETPRDLAELDQQYSSISFEEFKKSLVRVASLLTEAVVDQVKVKEYSKDEEDALIARQEVYEKGSGQVPDFDDKGNSVDVVKRVIGLKKRPQDRKQKVKTMLMNSYASQPAAKLYDLTKLKVDTLKRLIDYVIQNLEGGKKQLPSVPKDYEETHRKLDVSNLSHRSGDSQNRPRTNEKSKLASAYSVEEAEESSLAKGSISSKIIPIVEEDINMGESMKASQESLIAGLRVDEEGNIKSNSIKIVDSESPKVGNATGSYDEHTIDMMAERLVQQKPESRKFKDAPYNNLNDSLDSVDVREADDIMDDSLPRDFVHNQDTFNGAQTFDPKKQGNNTERSLFDRARDSVDNRAPSEGQFSEYANVLGSQIVSPREKEKSIKKE